MNLIFRSSQNPNSHYTVRERVGPSLPVRLLFASGLVTGRVLDFGCGLGQDVKFLSEQGLDVIGYDPYYAPDIPTGRFDTILCIYVLNVLLPEEQAYVLMAVSELLNPSGRAYFAVRRDIAKDGFRLHLKHHVPVYQCSVRLPYQSKLKTGHSEIYEYHHYNQRVHSENGCNFCYPDAQDVLITESATAYALLDQDATLPGRAFIIPKKHEKDYFELSVHTRTACWMMVERVKKMFAEKFHPNDFEICVHTGNGDGSDLEHTYIHLISRFS